MIKVCHLITSLETGGAETMLQKVTGAADRSHFSNTVITMTSRAPVLGPRFRAAGIEVRRLAMRRGTADLRSLAELVGILQSEKPDILHCWMYHANLMGLAAAKIAGVPRLIWNIRASDLDFTHVHARLKTVFQWHSALAWVPNAVVVNSWSGREFHEARHLRSTRWHVVPNCFDTSRFCPDVSLRISVRAELGIPLDAPVVGIVARLDPMKDYPTFLSAISSLVRRVPTAHVIVSGRGTSRSAEPFASWLAAESSIASQVHILGERSDVERVMNALDVLVLSSRSGEGFPNALGEAMATGIPCVTTDVGDAARIVGSNGSVLQPGDVHGIAAAVIRIFLMNTEERKWIGQKCRQDIMTNYGLHGIARQYEDIYRSILV